MGDWMSKHKGMRLLKKAGQGVVMGSLVFGLVAFVGNGKEVRLSVDGKATAVQTYGATVQEVLAKANVSLTEHDRVSPALATEVRDGTTIRVQKARPVPLVLDGSATTLHTVGATVTDVLSELGVPRGSKVSEAGSTPLKALDGPLTITTPKNVTVTVDGRTKAATTTSAWLGELLTELRITLGPEDRLSIPSSSAVVNGMGLKITRVESGKRITVTKALPFGSTVTEDPRLAKGEKDVKVAGVRGERIQVFSVDLVDGKEVSRTLLSDKVTRKPVEEQIALGTKEPVKKAERAEAAAAPARPAQPARARGGAQPAGGPWAALAQCESGGNWSINSGNGYYGGLQFSESSWLGAGGGKYAPLPHLASPSEQIATAEVLKQNGGWGHWPSCSAKLGLG